LNKDVERLDDIKHAIRIKIV